MLFASVGSEAVVAVRSDGLLAFTSNQDGGEPITATHRVGAGLHHVSLQWLNANLVQQGPAPHRTPLPRFAERNSEEQFGYVFGRQFENVVMDRHGANDDLPPMFFDKPEFRNALTAWAPHEVFTKIRGDAT
jgi:hypothetical protein